MSHIMRAILYAKKGPRAAYYLGCASYEYTRRHGFSRLYAFYGGVRTALDHLVSADAWRKP